MVVFYCVCVLGEEWQVSKVGAYLPGAHEEVVDIVNAFILTDKVLSSVPFPVIPCSFFSVHTLSRQVIRDWRVNWFKRKIHI